MSRPRRRSISLGRGSIRRGRSSSELPLRTAVACAIAVPIREPAAFDELRARLAEIADLGKAAALLGWDQQVMMPPRGAARPRRAARDARPHRAHEVHRSRDRPPARRARAASRRAARVRLVRGEPDPRRAPRLGEGAQGAVRAARRDVALRRARAPGLGRGAQERTTSRRSCRSSARTSSCASATSSASTATTPSRTTSCSTTTSAA